MIIIRTFIMFLALMATLQARSWSNKSGLNFEGELMRQGISDVEIMGSRNKKIYILKKSQLSETDILYLDKVKEASIITKVEIQRFLKRPGLGDNWVLHGSIKHDHRGLFAEYKTDKTKDRVSVKFLAHIYKSHEEAQSAVTKYKERTAVDAIKVRPDLGMSAFTLISGVSWPFDESHVFAYKNLYVAIDFMVSEKSRDGAESFIKNIQASFGDIELEQDKPEDLKPLPVKVEISRESIPSFAQGDYRGGEKSCGPASLLNFVIWWGIELYPDIIPGGTYKQKVKSVQRSLVNYCKSSTGGTRYSDLEKGVKKYFLKKAPNYIINTQHQTLPDRKWLEDNVKDYNGVIVAVGYYKESAGLLRRDGGHYVSLVSIEGDFVTFNTWGKTYKLRIASVPISQVNHYSRRHKSYKGMLEFIDEDDQRFLKQGSRALLDYAFLMKVRKK